MPSPISPPRRFTLCHTSDWHLGHTLAGYSRELEHDRFLSFLVEVLERDAVDALIVAGDVYHSANPPAYAQAQLYSFLARARAACPRLEVLIVAGNHDSPARLIAADPVLTQLGVTVVGALPRIGRGGRAPVDAEALVVPLHDADGVVAARVAALPFLRSTDRPIPAPGEPTPTFVESVRAVYDVVLEAARAQLEPSEALLATGHCHMVNALESELSERRIAGGPRDALPVDLFSDDVAYVALGHLHLAQAIDDDDRPGGARVRYSGSPIPLSMPESAYRHQLRLARFEGGACVAQEEVPIPRSVEVLRVPADGPGELDAVLAELEALRSDPRFSGAVPRGERAFLDVRLRLSEPTPGLRRRVETALGDAAVRLTKISVEYTADGQALADAEASRSLGDLSFDDVFRRAYARRYDGEPGLDLLEAFHEIVESARRTADGEAPEDLAKGAPAPDAERASAAEESRVAQVVPVQRRRVPR